MNEVPFLVVIASLISPQEKDSLTSAAAERRDQSTSWSEVTT